MNYIPSEFESRLSSVLSTSPCESPASVQTEPFTELFASGFAANSVPLKMNKSKNHFLAYNTQEKLHENIKNLHLKR